MENPSLRPLRIWWRRSAARAAACASLALAACTQAVSIEGLAEAPRIVGQRERVSGRETGVWTWSYPDGTTRERGTLVDGRRTGTWTTWWMNGEKRSEGARVPLPDRDACPRDGPWTFWHPNGAVAARGVYRLGEREGDWEYTLDDGRIVGEMAGQYHDDVRIGEE